MSGRSLCGHLEVLVWWMALACSSPSGDDLAPLVVRNTLEVGGEFHAAIDHPLPGNGGLLSISNEPDSRPAIARATYHDTSGAEPVLAIELLVRRPDGWDRLELDVAAERWSAGPLTVDGTVAGGVFERADGTRFEIQSGTVEVLQAGRRPADVVDGFFEGLVLVEAP